MKCYVLFVCFFWWDAIFAHDDFVNVIKRVKPSVVMVDVALKRKLFGAGSKREKEREEALGKYADFFKDEFKATASKSTGSGFVINRPSVQDSIVWVLTAAHVVKNASKIEVTFTGDVKKPAKVVWTDTAVDVALLRVKYPEFAGGLNLSQRSIDDGDGVLAISGAFGFGLSSSIGIVSAQNVRLRRSSKRGVLQTDAAINPGSSGGPLLNANGEVIGLISNIYSKTGTFSGTAFAVPTNTLKELMLKHQ